VRPQRESSEFAHECLKGSHIVSPREAFLRASTYWKTGQFSTAKTRDSSKCTSVTSADEGITSGIWSEERTPLDSSLAGCPRTTPNLAPVRRPVAHFPSIRWATRRIRQIHSLRVWNLHGIESAISHQHLATLPWAARVVSSVKRLSIRTGRRGRNLPARFPSMPREREWMFVKSSKTGSKRSGRQNLLGRLLPCGTPQVVTKHYPRQREYPHPPPPSKNKTRRIINIVDIFSPLSISGSADWGPS
jgi:hypothetical protein